MDPQQPPFTLSDADSAAVMDAYALARRRLNEPAALTVAAEALRARHRHLKRDEADIATLYLVIGGTRCAGPCSRCPTPCRQ